MTSLQMRKGGGCWVGGTSNKEELFVLILAIVRTLHLEKKSCLRCSYCFHYAAHQTILTPVSYLSDLRPSMNTLWSTLAFTPEHDRAQIAMGQLKVRGFKVGMMKRKKKEKH